MNYKNDAVPLQDIGMAYYNDTDQLDFDFYKQERWRPEVWDKLSQAQAFGVEDRVSEEEVDKWRDRTLNWYNSGKSQHTYPVKYMSYEDLDVFTDYAARKCGEYLVANGLAE